MLKRSLIFFLAAIGLLVSVSAGEASEVLADTFSGSGSVELRDHMADSGHTYNLIQGVANECVVESGILICKAAQSFPYKVKIFNPDGTELEMVSGSFIAMLEMFPRGNFRVELRKNSFVTVETQIDLKTCVRVFNEYIDGSGTIKESVCFAAPASKGEFKVEFSPAFLEAYWDGSLIGRVDRQPVGGNDFVFVSSFGFTSLTKDVEVSEWHLEPSDASPPAGEIPLSVSVLVSIDRILEVADGCGDNLFSGEPEFFAKVVIGDKEFISDTVSGRDIAPGWEFIADVTPTVAGEVPISILVFEKDFFVESECDINEDPSRKNLKIIYNADSEIFSGDSTASGKLITNSTGFGADSAEVCFGASRGGHVTFCDANPVQVSLNPDANSDGVTDLVNHKPAVVLGYYSIHGSVYSGMPVSLVLSADGVVLDSREVTLDELEANRFGELFFTPDSSGGKTMLFEVVQDHFISRVFEEIWVKDTRTLNISIVRINGCQNGECYGSVTDARLNDTITEGKQAVLALFPISESDVNVVDVGRSFAGDSTTEQAGETSTGAFITKGIVNDLRVGCVIAKRWQTDTEITVVVVPRGYFDYHGLPGWHGVAFLGGLMKCVIVEEGHGSWTPHEIAHLFSVDHRFALPNGYYVNGVGAVDPLLSANYMCSGHSSCSNQMPPGIWSDSETYNMLFGAFVEIPQDPELALISGFIDKDGIVDIVDTEILDNGTVTMAESGLYSIGVLDKNGALIFELPFDASFEIEGAKLNYMPFVVSVPFPPEAKEAAIIKDGVTLVKIDPRVKSDDDDEEKSEKTKDKKKDTDKHEKKKKAKRDKDKKKEKKDKGKGGKRNGGGDHDRDREDD